VFALVVAVSVVVLFMPGNHVPHTAIGVDKVVHCSLFLTLCASGLLAGCRARWLVPILVAYAVSSEFIQTLPILQRDFSVWDIAADCTGVLLGALLIRLRRAA
jgi:VanZ family protein